MSELIEVFLNWNWYLIGGYLAFVCGFFLALVTIYLQLDKDDDYWDRTTVPYGSILFAGLSIWLFFKAGVSIDSTEKWLMYPFWISVGILAVAIISGLLILSAKKSSAAPIGQKIAISSIAGLISTSIAYYLGIGQGISIFSASIGGLVFLTVSILSA